MLKLDTVIALCIVGFAAVYLVKKFFFNKEGAGCSCGNHECGDKGQGLDIKNMRSACCKDGCVDKNCSGE